jgi:exopolysaccharide production protein ExoZ
VIGNLQILRGVAALSVVFYHTAFLLPGGIHTDFSAVATFFVISGFIMCFISEKDPSGFFSKRLLRIIPLYWLCTAVLEFAIHRWGFLRPWTWHADFAESFLRSILFIPSKDHPLLSVGWTLNLEMYFYAIFAVALLLSKRLGPLIAAAAVLVGLALPSAGCDLAVCEVYANSYNRYFVAGIAFYYVWLAVAPRLPRGATVAISGFSIIACYAIQCFPASAWTEVVPLVLVAAALFMTSVGFDVQWKPLVLFGDASYATYLTHIIVMQYIPGLVAAGLLAQPDTSVPAMLLVLAACQTVGIGTHLCVEKPLGRALRHRFRGRIASNEKPNQEQLRAA